MNIEEFVNELSRPLYVWRMARSIYNQVPGGISRHRVSPLEKGAPTRMAKAKKEIEDLVLKYAESIIQERAIENDVRVYPQVKTDEDRDEWPNDIDAARDYGGRK